MADTHKVLGQSNPVAATLTDAYTVPASTGVILSCISICNRSATPTSFRVAVAPNGEANNDKHYITYDQAIGANDTKLLVIGITLDATDVVRVYATLATLSFGIFGVEITA